jgi:hypothetical protein
MQHTQLGLTMTSDHRTGKLAGDFARTTLFSAKYLDKILRLLTL